MAGTDLCRLRARSVSLRTVDDPNNPPETCDAYLTPIYNHVNLTYPSVPARCGPLSEASRIPRQATYGCRDLTLMV